MDRLKFMDGDGVGMVGATLCVVSRSSIGRGGGNGGCENNDSAVGFADRAPLRDGGFLC